MNWWWILTMAWRDSRHSRRRLFLYMSAIIMGVAALVSIRSFGESLLQSVEGQAKALLGADLSIRSGSAFTPEAEAFLSELGGEQARLTSFSSMALFPSQQGTRLVSVRALSGGFPFYGKLLTEPESAAGSYLDGAFALVDRTVMLQFGLKVGDPVKLGSVVFTIAGSLLEIPGESMAFSEFAPRVYIPLEYLDQTGLIQLGSRVRYSAFFRFEPSVDADALVERYKDRLEALELRADTVEERKEDFRRELGNMNRFLSLVGFIALVLGGVGVASSIHLYVRQRIGTVAILRCVGATPRQSLAIYVVQATSMGFLGAAIGGAVGLAIQRLIPILFSELIPVEFQQHVSWGAVAEGLAVGLGTALLFALIPLVAIRRVSPLLAIRAEVEHGTRPKRDPVVFALYGLLLAALLGFSLLYTARVNIGLGFFFGLLVVFGLLFAVAKAIMWSTKRFFPSNWRYEWRQGLANLYRPHNQTIVLMLAVGLGTFFIVTLYLTQLSLLEQVSFAGAEDRPNLILFDIQTTQKDELRELVASKGLPVMQEVPIVTMRIASVKGVPVEELTQEGDGRRGRWALRREYRCTYREELSDAETVVEGEFPGSSVDGIPAVSLEQGIAEELGVKIGDELVFDVQGISIETRVGSFRSVEWRNFQTNFFIVFPPGVLEEAPQFHVLITRTDSAQASAELQRDAIVRFPNVSAIDLSLVIKTINSVLDKLAFVIRFMALFSIITGFVVLSGAVVSGRFQRMKECVLLRTLGASRGQIRRILMIEYLFLGLFAALTGLLLAVAASWAVTLFVFETVLVPAVSPIVIALVAVVALTILIGMSNSRGILAHSPLEVLRAEE